MDGWCVVIVEVRLVILTCLGGGIHLLWLGVGRDLDMSRGLALDGWNIYRML